MQKCFVKWTNLQEVEPFRGNSGFQFHWGSRYSHSKVSSAGRRCVDSKSPSEDTPAEDRNFVRSGRRKASLNQIFVHGVLVVWLKEATFSMMVGGSDSCTYRMTFNTRFFNFVWKKRKNGQRIRKLQQIQPTRVAHLERLSIVCLERGAQVRFTQRLLDDEFQKEFAKVWGCLVQVVQHVRVLGG